MHISTMRLADRWLGVPVCVALTAARKLSSILGRRAAGPPRRIVFVKLAEQGSTVLACSALRRAAEMVGRENVYFLAFEENRFILDLMDLIPRDNIIAIRTGGLIGTIFGALRAIRRMRRLRIDTAVDLEFFARSSAALCCLSGARRRVGFHAWGGAGPYRGNLMTHRLLFNPHLHTTQTFRLLVEAINVPAERLPTLPMPAPAADDPPPPFQPSAGETAEVRRLLRDASPTGHWEPLVLLNCNCSDLLPLRRWPSERYVELARRLIDRYPGVHVAMTGAPDEERATAALAAQAGSDRCFSLAGRTTLRQLLVVYTLAEVLVTNDSGPAHFAALTPIEVITLFGPESPRLFAARSPRNHVMWEGIACSPCVSAFNNRTSPCRDNQCMQRIETDVVFEEICRLLEARVPDVLPVPIAASGLSG